MRNKAVVNLGVLATGEVLTRGLTFLAFVHLARVLNPESFGLVEWTFAALQFCMLLVDQGFGVIGTREIARNTAATEAWTGRVVSARIMLAAATFGLLAIVAAFLGSELRVLLLGMGVSLFGLPFLLNWVFQGRGQMAWFAIPQVIRQAVFLAFVVVTISAPHHLTRLPLAEICAVAAAAICYVCVFRFMGLRLRLKLSVARLDRDLIRSSLPVSGSQLIWALRMYLPILLLLFLVGNEETGLFGVSHRIVMVFQALLAVYFTNLFPIISRASIESLQRLRRLVSQSVAFVTLSSIALACVVFFAAPSLIGLIFGGTFVAPDSVWTLVTLIWVIPILAVRRHATDTLVALNQQRTDFWWSLVGILLLAILLIPCARQWGPVGAAWAMLASEMVPTVGLSLQLLAVFRRNAPLTNPLLNQFALSCPGEADGVGG